MISRHLVSIIVPAYNSDKFISETLDSVIAQTYAHWECIVIDDGSTDNTKEIVAEYCRKEPRISYRYQENAGPSVARNNGIAHTTGEYILPLDSDDIIADTYLEKAVNRFISHPETTLVYCKATFCGESNSPWNLPQYDYNKFIWVNCIFNSSFYKRIDFLNTNGYNVDMRLGLEDWDFLLTLLKPHSIVYQIPESLFFYRKSHTSRSHTAWDHNNELSYQLLINHPDVYTKYASEIFVAKAVTQSNSFIVYEKLIMPIISLKKRFRRLIISICNK